MAEWPHFRTTCANGSSRQLPLSYFPRIIFGRFRENDRGWGMSENSERMPFPATEPNACEKWGDPPPWSPWNFHNPKANREEQETSLRRRLRQLVARNSPRLVAGELVSRKRAGVLADDRAVDYRLFRLPPQSSASRFTAGAAEFLILS